MQDQLLVEAKALYYLPLSVPETARRLHVSQDRVRNIFRFLGLPPKTHRRVPYQVVSEAQYADLKELYFKGIPLLDIAKQINVAPETASKMMGDIGLFSKKKASQRGCRWIEEVSLEEKQEMRHLFFEGMTISELSAKFSLSDRTTRSIFRELGVNTPSFTTHRKNRKYKDLTGGEMEIIRNLYYEGQSFSCIQENLKITNRTLRQALKDLEINTQKLNRYTLNENYFDVIDTPEKAYILGLFAADGCVTKTNYLALQLIDTELIDFVAKEIEFTGKTRLFKPAGGCNNQKISKRINFSPKTMVDSLQKYGIIPNKSLTYEFVLSGIYQWAFVLGYFDGDGCAYVSSRMSKTTSNYTGGVNIVGSESFCNNLFEIFGFGKVVRHSSNSVFYWKIHSKNHIRAFADFVYQNKLGLVRKRNKITQLTGN